MLTITRTKIIFLILVITLQLAKLDSPPPNSGLKDEVPFGPKPHTLTQDELNLMGI